MKMLFVDDMAERFDHLVTRWKGPIQWVVSASEAIDVLGQDTFDADIVSLDHDLASEHYIRACSANSGCGCDIVDWICENADKFREVMFVIHSWNSEAAQRMYRALINNNLQAKIRAFD